MKKIQEFLWYCAGANVDLLRKCPTADQKKYALIGFSLLVVGVISTAIIGYTSFSSVTSSVIVKALINLNFVVVVFVFFWIIKNYSQQISNRLAVKGTIIALLLILGTLVAAALSIKLTTPIAFSSFINMSKTFSSLFWVWGFFFLMALIVNTPLLILLLSKKGFYEMTLEYEYQQLMIEHHKSIERFYKENPNTYYTPIEKVVAQNSDAYVEGIVSAFDLTGSSNAMRRYKSTIDNNGEDKNNGYLKDAQARQQDYLNWAGDVRKSFETLKQEIESGEYSAF